MGKPNHHRKSTSTGKRQRHLPPQDLSTRVDDVESLANDLRNRLAFVLQELEAIKADLVAEEEAKDNDPISKIG